MALHGTVKGKRRKGGKTILKSGQGWTLPFNKGSENRSRWKGIVGRLSVVPKDLAINTSNDSQTKMYLYKKVDEKIAALPSGLAN